MKWYAVVMHIIPSLGLHTHLLPDCVWWPMVVYGNFGNQRSCMFHCSSEQKGYLCICTFSISCQWYPFLQQHLHLFTTCILLNAPVTRRVHLLYSILGLSCPLSCCFDSYIHLFCQIRNVRCYCNAMLTFIVIMVTLLWSLSWPPAFMVTGSLRREKHSCERQKKKGTLALLNLNVFWYKIVSPTWKSVSLLV